MLKNLGIVEACFTTDAARARATRKLGGKPVIEWVVRRATDALRLDAVIVVTRDDPGNRFLSDVVPLDVPVFYGRQNDSLGCLAAAIETYRTEGAVTVPATSLFLDPGLIDRLVSTADEHPDCDYVSYCCRDGRPAVYSPVAVFGEWFRASALYRVARKASMRIDREHPSSYLFSRPDRFTAQLIPAPAQIDRDDLRLIVDMEEDWDHVLTIFDALGPDALDWQRIADLLSHQPALRARMAALNRVHAKG